MKIAFIGVGRMGRRHIQVARELGLTIGGICDQAPESLAVCSQELGIATGMQYRDAAQMLKEVEPDCVIVATTSPTHAVYTTMAAETGAEYILCEKPMAISLAQCNGMIHACHQAGVSLAINHQMRFMEQYTEPKRIIATPEFGGLGSITVVGGNFGLAMNGTHYFEMFRFVTDERPDVVTAWFSDERVPNPRGPQFEDRAGSVRVSTASGKRLYMDVSADQGHGVRVIYGGRYGQLTVDELRGKMTLSVRNEMERHLPTTRYGVEPVEHQMAIQPADPTSPTRSVLRALLGKDNYPSGEEGRLAVATLVAAYCSAEGGHLPVHVDKSVLPVNREFPWA